MQSLNINCNDILYFGFKFVKIISFKLVHPLNKLSMEEILFPFFKVKFAFSKFSQFSKVELKSFIFEPSKPDKSISIKFLQFLNNPDIEVNKILNEIIIPNFPFESGIYLYFISSKDLILYELFFSLLLIDNISIL